MCTLTLTLTLTPKQPMQQCLLIKTPSVDGALLFLLLLPLVCARASAVIAAAVCHLVFQDIINLFIWMLSLIGLASSNN